MWLILVSASRTALSIAPWLISPPSMWAMGMRKASATDVARALAEYISEPQRTGLPTAPERPVIVRAERNRPQTRLDRMASGGMAVVVGQIRPCPILDFRFTLLVHNTIRGAAGASILNAEWLVKKDLLRTRDELRAAAAGVRTRPLPSRR